MPFALDSSPEISEIADAINYLLANYVGNVSADPNTGQVVGPQGIVVSYLYRYLSVKYADSFDGSLNFSNSPTNRGYYGLSNSNSSTESTNPADYIWYKVAGGFGTTKFLFYQTIGGRGINFVVATSAPDSTYIQKSGSAIDLDVITSGVQANSSAVAYLVQSQSDPAPTGFPRYTTGNNLPSGWSSNIGTVSVGQVAWYSFGIYNGSSVAVNGIPANSTYWTVPVAASIFQDIRSDNWNGSNPPSASSVSSWGTNGYYIAQGDGNMYANGFYARGKVQIEGNNNDLLSTAARINQSNDAAIGVYAFGNQSSGRGLAGTSNSSSGVGVVGSATSSSARAGVLAFATSGASVALEVAGGAMVIDNSTLVTNLNADLLDGQNASAFVNVAGGTSNGKYIYYVNNTGAPSNPITRAAWILISTNDGGTVYIPGYL